MWHEGVSYHDLRCCIEKSYYYFITEAMNANGGSPYEDTKKQSKFLAMRMRSGTGVNRIIGGQDSGATHFIDALQRFQKDYAVYDKTKRDEQNRRRQMQLEQKRLQNLQRQNKRWQVVEENEQMKDSRIQKNMVQVIQGKKRTANSNGLAYNPINLNYDSNEEGEKLRLSDQNNRIRGLVRAYNMDHSGNSAYNPLNGVERRGINKIVPPELEERYIKKLGEFEQTRKLKVPQTSNQVKRNIFQYY